MGKQEPFCNRCGLCCEAFSLPFSHQDFAEGEEALLERFTRSSIAFTGGKYEGDTLLSFLEPVSFEKAQATGLNESIYDLSKEHYYSCKLFERDDQGLGVCTAHEHRPAVCSRYRPRTEHDPDGNLVSPDQVMQKGCSYLDYWRQEDGQNNL